ncbi:thiamine-phosphate kinase [Sedimentisphaera salicampi]|uniref:Thiamine-monophosphate kinase n=1 Tax=Sedimentisphaera salicampi TaxID=1941349 RepID=A0A1W6LQ00_9BACT|nr:thiamine-phosphate kinase [Sedimentisphaera salicampi]ARN57812.1 Thiamine-monophosphate kinase [Sedimentisphaera salicampi]OXU13980.1 Thiamine-monophosphate kinase [Sedimentisphaera salicampi]
MSRSRDNPVFDNQAAGNIMDYTEDSITAYFAQAKNLNSDRFPIGIGDDMAQMQLENSNALISTDMLLDGSHFDTDIHSPENIGYKAAAVSLSDAAAMATVPFAMVASVGIPDWWGAEKLKELHSGLLRACSLFQCSLIGGDITSWRAEGKLAVCSTVISRPGVTKPLERGGAKQEDLICVTGELGGSLEGKHINFTPKVNEALWIAEKLSPTSMMDITDGLSTDLHRILKASGAGAILESELIPVSKAAKDKKEPLRAALNDGEDFELLFTIPEKNKNLIKNADFKISVIGKIASSNGLFIKNASGQTTELKPEGFDHLG